MDLQGFVHGFKTLQVLADELLHIADGSDIVATLEFGLQLLCLGFEMPVNETDDRD